MSRQVKDQGRTLPKVARVSALGKCVARVRHWCRDASMGQWIEVLILTLVFGGWAALWGAFGTLIP